MLKEKMTSKIETAKTFVKEHKIEIAVTTGVVATGVAGILLGRKAKAKAAFKTKELEKEVAACMETLEKQDYHYAGHLANLPFECPNGIEITDAIQFTVGNSDRDFTELIVNNFTTEDLGEVGKALMDFAPDVFEHNRVLSMCINDTTFVREAVKEVVEEAAKEVVEEVVEEAAKEVVEDAVELAVKAGLEAATF